MLCAWRVALAVVLAVVAVGCSRDWDGLVEEARKHQADSDAGDVVDGGHDAGGDAGVEEDAGGDAATPDAAADAGMGTDAAAPDAGACDAGDEDEDGVCDDVDDCFGIGPEDDDGDGICDDRECVRYVRPNGLDDNGGLSWDDAVRHVQQAIGLAQGEQCDVWVAEGTYVPTLDENGDTTPPDPRELSFVTTPGVSLYGGFAGNESDREDRPWPRLPTVLSGDLGVVGDDSDNAYHVVMATNDVVIDGFTIAGGRVRVSRTGMRDRGAGLRAEAADRLFVRDVWIQDNAAVSGGGVFVLDSADVKLQGVVVEGNSADLVGGGVFVQGSQVIIDQSEIRQNVAVTGAGVRVEGSTLDLVASQVNDNTGHGLSVDNANEPMMGVNLYESIVFANTRGGLFAVGGQLYIEGSMVVANAGAPEGAGVYLDSGDLELSTSVVSHNDVGGSTGNGAGVWVGQSNLTITDSSFVRNLAGNVGGAVYAQTTASLPASTYIQGTNFVGNASTGGGGAIYSTGPILDVVDSGFFANEAFDGNGAGIAVLPPDGELYVSGSTFGVNTAGSYGGAIYFEGTDLTWVNGVAYGNAPDTLTHTTGVVDVDSLCADYPPPGSGIIDLDGSVEALGAPFDAIPGSGELYLYQPTGGTASACVDAGNMTIADDDLSEWPNMTTALTGDLDVGRVDLGRHYAPDKALIDFVDTSTADLVAWSSVRADRCWLFLYGVEANGNPYTTVRELDPVELDFGNEMLPTGFAGGVTLACFGVSGEPAVVAEVL